MRPAWLILLLSLVLLGEAGCRNEQTRLHDRSVRDDLNRIVHLPDEVRRIATLSPSVTELVFAAGAGSRIVGVSVVDNFPPAVDSLPRFNTYPPDLESIIALRPDLILASDQVNHPDQVAVLERLGIPTYFLAFSRLRSLPHTMRSLGELLGTGAAAGQAADSLERRMSILRQITSSVESRPSVLVLASSHPLHAFGTESYIHDLIDLAGGTSTTAHLESSAPTLSDEFVLRSRPDVIIGSDPEQFSAHALLAARPTWDAVPAVREERVYAVNPDLLFRPGPRLVQGAWEIAAILHPDLIDLRTP